MLQDYWHWQPGDVLLHALPLFHVHGLFVASHGALLNGSKMIFLPKFDAADVMHHLPRSTVFMGVPTYYVRLLAESSFGTDTCANMRLFISGSAPLLTETFIFRYSDGARFVEAVRRARTAVSHDGEFSNPPQSSDQMLHPHRVEPLRALRHG